MIEKHIAGMIKDSVIKNLIILKVSGYLDQETLKKITMLLEEEYYIKCKENESVNYGNNY